MKAGLVFSLLFLALIASVISGGLAEQVQEFPDDDDEVERDIFEQEVENEDDPIEAMKDADDNDPGWGAVGNLFTRRRRTPARRRRTPARRRRSSGRKWKPNGCNVPFNLSAPYKKRFTPACNAHDICYYYKKKSRKGCDVQFLQDMNKACKKISNKWFHSFGRATCLTTAKAYYKAARVGGAHNYGPNGR